MDEETLRTAQSPDGRRYLTPTDAARRACMTEDVFAARVAARLAAAQGDDPAVASHDTALIGQLRGPGRRPKQMISVEFVDALRRERLQEFDVLTDLDRLQSEVSDTRTAWESEVANLKGRIKILETAIVELIAAARERTVTLAAQGAWEERHLRSTAASLGLSAHESQVDPNT